MVLMFVFPPFLVVREHGTFNAGYHFFIDYRELFELPIVNVPLLFVRYMVVGVVACIAFIALKDGKGGK